MNDTVTLVGEYAFTGTGLTNVHLANATKLYPYAFSNCPALQKVVLPMVTDAGISAQMYDAVYTFQDSHPKFVDFSQPVCFRRWVFGSSDLKGLILRSRTISTAGHSQVFRQGLAGYIYVPKIMDDGTDGIAAYEAASNWSVYAGKFRYIEDYTVDGTLTGELDESKI